MKVSWCAIVTLLVILGHLGCGGEDANSDKPRARFMYPCSADADCLAGYVCADRGSIAGLCSKTCTYIEQCESSVGDEKAYCQTLDVFFCAKHCISHDDCPTHHCKTTTKGEGLYCIP